MTQPDFMLGYDEFATPAQQAAIDAVRGHGTIADAIRALNVDPRGFRRKLSVLRKSAATRGFAPSHGMDTPAPEGTTRARTSTLWKTDPETGLRTKALEWEINVPEKQQREAEFLLDFADELHARMTPAAAIPKPTVMDGDDTLTVYPMGDPHIGMYAWAEETGDDFDVEIATGQLERAMSRLVASTPNSEEALIVNLGDFFHMDNASNMTSKSHNVLDVDTRWQRVLKLGAGIMFRLVELALMSHHRVTVRNAIGNHDDHSSVMLSLLMAEHFRNNDRVTIDTSPAQHWYHRFGTTLLGVTHGDRCKMAQLPLVMAADRPEDWGKTKYRHWLTGHVHNRRVEEHGGVLCESFRTLAARDAYAAGAGYRSGRDMHAISFHRAFGEVERHRVDIAVVR